jgi:hypothetical protein
MKCEMTCETLPRWIEPYLDDQLDVPTAHGIVDHLTSCPSCTRKFQSERELRGLIQRALTKGTKAPDGLWEKFAHRALHVPGPIGLLQLVDAAAKYHRNVPAGLKIAGVAPAAILAYYRDAAGYLPCPGHVTCLAKAGAPWESAGILRDAFPGRSLAWKNYRGETAVASQTSMPRDYVSVLNAGELKYPFYTFTRGSLSVSVMDCPQSICTFVTEGEEFTRRVRRELYAEFSSFMGPSKPTLGEPRASDW